ncbi:MAG: sigma-70 family RNA polymerase sigma factor [Candidatus Dojkabacteria bacterium]|uniref:ECF RNA polymerase sigma factor SigW n=2 Tax=Candidatus Dojkabacteria TaxID=74243 RepID=A0A136KER7_9BACT|nr:MAG: ECF RNA polymerase sigma factor SigW [candidate division WS6 bacterium OLB21]MBW7953304.1 sigma-70 family RNA polymerase sigma factor [Candidatus Dojkabacteria bacterium]WKZ28445.1 MAG: sigma-70 family RNA polymerase sigma factor [Candidatus Dojkabacteria bacterium]
MELAEELKLIEEAKSNLQAFNKLYDMYFDGIFRYCSARLPQREVAEDITSQVFMSAVEKLADFDTTKGYRFGSWLYRVAHNKVIDYYRRGKYDSMNDFSSVADESLSVESDAIQEELQVQVAFVLSKLNSRYQEVITYKFYSDLSNDEIAKIMKIRTDNVKVLAHRALQSFKVQFQKHFPDTETFILD